MTLLIKKDVCNIMTILEDPQIQMRAWRDLLKMWHPDKHCGKPNMSLLATLVTGMLTENPWIK